MERERIEKLAIDSAMGELNEDAKILLGVYLAEHLEAKQWADDMLQIYEQTQAAIDMDTKEDDAYSKTTVFKMKSTSRMKWLAVGRWAAVVILMISIGVIVGRWTKPKQIVQQQDVRVVSGRKFYRPGYNENSFWYQKAMALNKPRYLSRSGMGFERQSLWGKYRQYIQEKNYE